MRRVELNQLKSMSYKTILIENDLNSLRGKAKTFPSNVHFSFFICAQKFLRAKTLFHAEVSLRYTSA